MALSFEKASGKQKGSGNRVSTHSTGGRQPKENPRTEFNDRQIFSSDNCCRGTKNGEFHNEVNYTRIQGREPSTETGYGGFARRKFRSITEICKFGPEDAHNEKLNAGDAGTYGSNFTGAVASSLKTGSLFYTFSICVMYLVDV